MCALTHCTLALEAHLHTHSPTHSRQIKIDCSDFWAGSMPRNRTKNQYKVSAPCIPNHKPAILAGNKTIPPSEKVLEHFLPLVSSIETCSAGGGNCTAHLETSNRYSKFSTWAPISQALRYTSAKGVTYSNELTCHGREVAYGGTYVPGTIPLYGSIRSYTLCDNNTIGPLVLPIRVIQVRMVQTVYINPGLCPVLLTRPAAVVIADTITTATTTSAPCVTTTAATGTKAPIALATT